jgi:hypothetical protein
MMRMRYAVARPPAGHKLKMTIQPEQAPSATVDTLDRRRAVRVAHCAPFVLRRVSPPDKRAPHTVTVVLQDLSATGMGVIHSDAVPVGQQFEVPLETGASPEVPRPPLVCTVVRCERLDDGLYNIGLIFNSSAETIDAGSRQLTGQPPPPRE